MEVSEERRLYTPEYLKVTLAFSILFTALTFFYLLPVHIEALGGSRLMIGFTMGACEATAVATRLLFSTRMDRIGRKRVLAAGGSCLAAGCFLFCLVRRADALPIFLRILIGAGYGAILTASFTIVADMSPPHRLAEGLGTLGIGAMVGQGVGPWIGYRLVAAYGFTALFAAAGILALFGLGITLLMRESTSPEFCLAYRSGYRHRLSGAFPWLMAITLFYAAGRGSIISFFSDFAHDRGIENAGLFFLSFSAAAVAGRALGGRAIDRTGRLRMLVPSVALFAAGLVSIPLIDSLRPMVLSGALCGLGQAFIYPVLISLAAGQANACDLGLTIGIFTAVFDAGLGFGSFLWGALAASFGYPAMYLSAASLAASGAAFRRKVG